MKKLARLTENKIIGGVCSGLAGYFSIDPIIIRLIFVLTTFSHAGIIAIYLILWVLMPKYRDDSFRVSFTEGFGGHTSDDDTFTFRDESFSTNEFTGEIAMKDTIKQQTGKNNMVGGVILITVGIILLANNFLPGIDVFDYWPLLLVGIGVGVLMRALRSKNDL